MSNERADMPSVFSYLDFRAYLRDWFAAKKAKNPRFSHRLFARKADQRSPSALLAVIEGKRNLTPQSSEGFVKAIGLDAEESAFFQALVRMQCADDAEMRDQALAQVRATRRFREARKLEGGALEYLSRWYYAAVRELATTKAFQADPAWISSVLAPPITEAQAAEALRVLFDLGMLIKERGGKVRIADVSLVTPHEVAGLAARQYHLAMIERARDSLSLPSTERHILGVTVAVPSTMLPALKRELDRFQMRVLELCDGAAEDREVVLQLEMQLFPLSRKLGER